jgi:hypothetical protein
VNTGVYKITAFLGDTASEKTITVENYVLPKIKLVVETDKTFYLPGEQVKGSVRTNYFFGEPVSGGEVRIGVFTYEAERVVEGTVQGRTDEMGNFEDAFELPDFFIGTDFDQGSGRFSIQATVTDLFG